jgi:hypothetical protein
MITEQICKIPKMCFPNDPILFVEPLQKNAEATAACLKKIVGICLEKASPPSDVTIFGFSEFVTALALLILIYQFTDVRYRFRIAVAPIRLNHLALYATLLIGFGTLYTDLWFAKKILIPHFLNDHAALQGMWGIIFLLYVILVLLYAFVKPPVFCRWNYKRYAHELYRYILKGSAHEIPIIAHEIARSAPNLVKWSRQVRRWHSGNNQSLPKANINSYAHDILLLLGNKKLCRHIVSDSPATAIAIFEEMRIQEKYALPLGQFAKNISTEAILNKDSLLYHEDEGYHSGLIGYLKPFSKAVYGHYPLVEQIGYGHESPLDIDYKIVWAWEAEQLEAYCRVTLLTLASYLERQLYEGRCLFRAFEKIERSCYDIYKLNGSEDYYQSDISKRLKVAVTFFRDAIDLINKCENPPKTRLRNLKDDRYLDIYDRISAMMFEIILHASSAKQPQDTCWQIQYCSVWSYFFIFSLKGEAQKIILFKLRRLIYDEIIRLESLPNFQNSRILGFCLNVMGLTLRQRQGYEKNDYALHKAVLAWTQKNYLRLRQEHPDVAENCLLGGISFDEQSKRLVKTFMDGAADYLELKD